MKNLVETIKTLYLSGLSQRQISLRLGCSQSFVGRTLRDLNLSRPKQIARSVVGNDYLKNQVEVQLESTDGRITTLSLKPYHCRWPIRGVGSEVEFCGEQKESGCSYCSRHAKEAFA